MANINISGNVTLLKNSTVNASGVAVPPTDLEYGQIAINYNAKDPCIFIKVLGDNGATSIQKFVGEAVIAKTLSDILGESAADLATLKDLIKQFEGSSNDVLTLVKNIDAAVALKADTTALNSHKNSTSNPHSVTKAQVGLGSVVNKEQLGKTETAVNSNKLGNIVAANYWHNTNSNLSTVDWNAAFLNAYSAISLNEGANQRVLISKGDKGGYVVVRDVASNQTGAFRGYSLNGIQLELLSGGIKTVGDIIASSGNFSGANAQLLTINRTDSDGNNTIKFQGKSITKHLGFSNGILKVGNSGDLSAAGSYSIWHSGNSNLGTIDWSAKAFYSSSSYNLSSGGKTVAQITASTGNGGYLDLMGADGTRGGIIRGYNSNGLQAEFNEGGIKVAGEGLFNGAARDGIHSVIINGSAKANYYRFGSRKAGFTTVGYVGCGSSDKDTVYLNGSEDVQIGAGGRMNDIYIYSELEKGMSFNKYAAFNKNLIVGDGTAGTSTAPIYKDLNFKGAYGTYAQIRMPEISVTSGEGALEFWVRGKEGASTTAEPKRSMRIDYNGLARFYKNVDITKGQYETNIANTDIGNVFTFTDKNHNTGNAILCGMGTTGDGVLWNRGAGSLTFGTSGTERMRITETGYVGIGVATAAINNRLHVNGNIQISSGNFIRGEISGYSWNGGEGALTVHIADNIQQTPLLLAKRNSGTRLFAAELLNNGEQLRLSFLNNSRFMFTSDGKLAINKNGNRPTQALDVDGNGVFSGNLVVKGEAVAYSLDAVEARTVAAASATRLGDLEDVDLTGASDNFVLYRSTTTNSNGDRVWKARSDAKAWGDISGKPATFVPVDHNHIGSTYVTTPSDRGLKQDICTLSNSLNTILSINPVSYNWTTEAIEKYGFKNHSSIGVIAQEIENIIPTAVTQLDEQYKAVDYIQIIPYLVGAVKQLNNELANKNIAIENARRDYKRAFGESVKLKAELDALKIEVEQLKTALKQNLI